MPKIKTTPLTDAEHASQLRQLDHEFRRMADDLVQAIAAEEERTGQRDQLHFAYPTFCKAARNRLARLLESIESVGVQISSIERSAA